MASADGPSASGPVVLGIETSCDETAVAVVAGDVVRSNVIATQIPIHRRFGGVVPEIASRNHLEAILPVLNEALDQAGVARPRGGGRPAGVDAIAVTNRPGLIGALLVGVQTARSLALAWDLPIVGVHHIEAHCWASHLRSSSDEDRPGPRADTWLALAVSGGHTSLLRVTGPGAMEVLGATLDDAAGEAFDKTAKLLGLPYPGGPEIAALADHGDPGAFALPRGMRGRSDLAFSFSGLKTAARLQIEAAQDDGRSLQGQLLADLCASTQEAIVAQLCSVTARALDQTGLPELVVAGGVAANRALRAALGRVCGERGVRLIAVPPRWCTDNAAMIAGYGAALIAAGMRDDPHGLDAVASPTLRGRPPTPRPRSA